MNTYQTLRPHPRGIVSFRQFFAVVVLAFLPLFGFAQFSLNFDCGQSVSIEATMIGTSDSIMATIVVPGDTSTIDSILVEIAMKGNPVFWGNPAVVMTSAGETVMIPFPGLITNTGSNEDAAIYRTWVGPCQSIKVTTPVNNPMHYDDWQSLTIFQVRRDFGCVSGSSSGGDLLIFHACDTLNFEIDSITGATQDVSVTIPLSEIGDADTTRSAIISVNYIHNGAITNMSLDTFYGPDNLGNFALLFDRQYSIPGYVDSLVIYVISPDGAFTNNSCTQQLPFGGDSFIIGTVVVSSSCDECCSVEINCDSIGDQYLCSFDLVPPIPDEIGRAHV